MILDTFVDELSWRFHKKFLHVGGRIIFLLMSRFCFFNSMEKRIKQILKTCDICQKAKTPNRPLKAIIKPIVPQEPLEIVAVDLIGKLPTGKEGVKYIFVMIDTFSKYTITSYQKKRKSCIY